MSPDTAGFSEVLERELEYVRRRRYAATPANGVQRSLVGIALSGGGIRSATTNLGVLQALSKMGVLPLADYICTVSGGGYIGSCLSSLLSLGTRSSPANGKGIPVPQVMQGDDKPLFTTAWDQFPFNWETLRGAAQLRHLRTHGTFLVTRKGLLARETMRSVGHLVSGTIYHLTLVLLALTTVALVYMWILLGAGEAVDAKLRQMTAPVPTYATAYEERYVGTSRPTYRGENPEFSADRPADLHISDANPTFVQSTVFAYPGFWDRMTSKGTTIFDEVWNAGRTHAGYVAASVAYGALVALVAFAYLRRYSNISAHLTERLPADAGESQEDHFAVAKLGLAARISLLAVLGWLLMTAGIPAARRIGVPEWVSDRLTLPPWVPQSDTAPMLLLLLPIIVVGALRVASWAVHLLMPRFERYWTRDLRSLWGAYQAMASYAFVAALLLAVFPVAVYAFREHEAWVGLSGVASLVIARFLTFRGGSDSKPGRLPPALAQSLLGVAMAAGVALVLVAIVAFLVPDPTGLATTGSARPTPAMVEAALAADVRDAVWRSFYLAVGSGVLFIALGYLGSANKLSPHYFYRDRLAEAYLSTDEKADPANRTQKWLRTMRDNVEMKLSDLHYTGSGPTPSSPYHLVSCAINLAASRDLTRKDRKSGYFLFSKFFCGSTHTGYLPTHEYRANETKLARAITISGAAASSGIGSGTHFAQAFATVLFNLRLGYWMSNPGHRLRNSAQSFVFWPKWLWREIAMRTDEHSELVNLSDGGHTGDNVGIYPLLQRQCKLIIACDAECDPSIGFKSFTEAMRHAYVDLGIEVDIDLTMVRPDTATGMSRSHCAVGLVRYPARRITGADGTPIEDHPVGYLVYLKNSLTGDEPEPVLNYKSEHAAFPHESTVDQFFDDAQFESYRSLGFHIAEQTFAGWIETREFRDWLISSGPVAR